MQTKGCQRGQGEERSKDKGKSRGGQHHKPVNNNATPRHATCQLHPLATRRRRRRKKKKKKKKKKKRRNKKKKKKKKKKMRKKKTTQERKRQNENQVDRSEITDSEK